MPAYKYRLGASKYTGRPRRRLKKKRGMKKFKKPYTQAGTVANISGSGYGLAPYAKVKMVYNYYIDLNSVGQTEHEHQFRINSLYDIDYSGVGGQPPLYDNIAALWQYNRVKGCAVKLTATNDAAVRANVGLICSSSIIAAIGPYNTQTLLTDKPEQYFMELAPNGDTGSTKSMKCYFKFSDIAGKQYFNNSGYWAATGANPGAPIWLVLCGQSIDSTTELDVKVTLQFTLYVDFKEVDEQVQSLND